MNYKCSTRRWASLLGELLRNGKTRWSSNFRLSGEIGKRNRKSEFVDGRINDLSRYSKGFYFVYAVISFLISLLLILSYELFAFNNTQREKGLKILEMSLLCKSCVLRKFLSLYTTTIFAFLKATAFHLFQTKLFSLFLSPRDTCLYI